MFPIIYLEGQVESINRVIERQNLDLENIFFWLSKYGELEKPNEIPWVRPSPIYSRPFPDNFGRFHSNFGFINTFELMPENTIRIHHTFAEASRNRHYNKWVQE